MDTETETNNNNTHPAASVGQNYYLKTFQNLLNLLCHLLVGIIVGVNLLFVFRQTLPLSPTYTHIVLCVLGYQLLMAEAILSLSPHNGWIAHLKLVHKRRVHSILQITGSSLAIAGSFIMIVDKANQNLANWSSLHGIFGLVALVFTVTSLINGIASQNAYELRKFLPSQLSKITHICAGIIAFGSAGISLAFGYETQIFKDWAGTNSGPVVNTMITFTALLISGIIVAPLITFFSKFKRI